MLRSRVDPPAPHVTLIANGSSGVSLEIRASKLVKPYGSGPNELRG